MNTLGFNLDKSKIPQGRFSSVIDFYEKQRIYNITPGVIVNGLFIPFNPSHENIGVMFSAGADSTILLYILCKIIQEFGYSTKIVPITVVRFWETQKWAPAAKKRVYDYLKSQFPNIIQEQQWGFIPIAYELTPIGRLVFDPSERGRYNQLIGKANTDVYFFHSYREFIVDTQKLSAVYDATTTNPIDQELPASPKFRDVKELKWPYSYFELITQLRNYQLISPFKLIEKTWPMAQFDNFDLDDLKNLTRSCVEVDNADDGCGRLECFHCSERKWANENRSVFLKSFHNK